ncbi:MAG TPA: glyoxylate/hydroxypyruvate reductase A [Acetobacteraceae bacterium]|jgi:glyoxylate/hydroxypyruvate reductase A|nr:glyoxylate/hydroxypyruvate reductase A [Acetobacteraceae bacterium]
MTLLLVKSGGEVAFPEWQAHFATYAPHLAVRWWEDPSVDPDTVDYIVVWEPQPGRIARMRNLKVIFSSAAGVDHIVRDPDLPQHLPIVRMATTENAQTMGEYVCLAALSILRDHQRMMELQAMRGWVEFEASRTAPDTRVGILGLGHLGVAAARMLCGLGFQVHGWSRGRKIVEGVKSYAGEAELESFLAHTDILVGLLPDTPATRGLINARRIAMLPKGAGVINAGRGTLIVIPDLIAALDSRHLDSAVLDVFETEPPDPDHPVWEHPRITVTSHIAGYATRRDRAAAVARNIAAFERGDPLPNVYNPERGY